MASFDAAMNKLQLLKSRSEMLERKALHFENLYLSSDSSVSDMELALMNCMEAQGLWKQENQALRKSLKVEKRRRTVLGGAVVVLAGAVVWILIST